MLAEHQSRGGTIHGKGGGVGKVAISGLGGTNCAVTDGSWGPFLTVTIYTNHKTQI